MSDSLPGKTARLSVFTPVTPWTYMAFTREVKTVGVALFLATVFCCPRAIVPEYIATEDCVKEGCLYAYSATQTVVVGESRTSIKVRADVESTCESMGLYGGLKAVKLCAVLKNTAVDLEPVQSNYNANDKEATKALNYLLRSPFCFVQTSEGKVVSVYYNSDEKPSVVNFKKALAAAFQANFKRTEQQVEEDTLSTHVSQYSYENLGPDHWIMKRTVNPNHIIRFASSEMDRKSRIAVQKAEVVEYKEGVLLRSSGTVFVNAGGPAVTDDVAMARFTPDDGHGASYTTNGSDDFYATGTYSLILRKLLPNRTKLRRSADVSATHFPNVNQSSLSALDDKGETEVELKSLRAQMPSVAASLMSLHNNITDSVTANKVKKLLILESEHGALPGHVSARNEVIHYLHKISASTAENDVKMKALLFSFLAAEGSIESQQLLVKAIEEAKETNERDALTVQLAFIRNVDPGVLSLIENITQSSNVTTDPLILSYGALASSLSPHLQSRVIRFLHSHTNQSDDEAYVHLVHALGNAQSNQTDELFINSLSHRNPSVRLAAVYALRHRTDSPEVQRSLLSILSSFPSKDVTDTVLRALIAGAELHYHSYPEAVNDSLLAHLLTATEDDDEQKAMLAHYIRLLDPASQRYWYQVSHSRKKRGTQWNEDKPEYNLVEDLDTRNYDVRSYPSHKSYISGKSIGNKKIRLSAAFGAFAGFGAGTRDEHGGFKLLAKGVVQGTAFGHTVTALEALIRSQSTPKSGKITNQVYFALGGQVLFRKDSEALACSPIAIPLFKIPYKSLLFFETQIFICIGFVNLGVTLEVKLKLDAELSICIKDSISGSVSVIPTVGLRVTGSATASLAKIMKAGIDVSANLNYALTLQLSGTYKLDNGGAFQWCLNLYNELPDNSIDVYPYYQYMKMEFTDVGGFFRIPKLTGNSWGPKKKLELLAVNFRLLSVPKTRIWTSCRPSQYKTQ